MAEPPNDIIIGARYPTISYHTTIVYLKFGCSVESRWIALGSKHGWPIENVRKNSIQLEGIE